jgi:shikimate dehydrogenase
MISSSYQLAVVGWPVGHSLSPPLWEGMGARRGIAIEYGRYPVPPGRYDAWGALWSSDLSGFNVTSPFKEQAAATCARRGSLVERIGAANTVIREEDDWIAYSTDGYGFVRALLAVDEPIRDRSIVILGTGGAGRAVACAVADAGGKVTMVSRDPAVDPPGCERFPRLGWDELTPRGPFDIVVNATPIGRGVGESSAPAIPYHSWCSAALAVDLNYTPPVTAFLRAAHAAGARTLNGFGMLIYQACLGAALLIDGDPVAAESYEEDFWAVARKLAPQVIHG